MLVAMLLSLAIIACLTPKPAIDVDVSALGPEVSDEGRRRLHGALASRLIDEGYALGRAPEAISVALRPHPDGLRVIAVATHAVHAVELHGGPPELLELRATHAALDAISHVEAEHDNVDDLRPRVTLEVRGERQGGPPGELYLRLLPMVSAADVRVVPPSEATDWRLCVSDTDLGHRSMRVRRDVTCRRAWANPAAYPSGPLSKLLLEIERDAALPPRHAHDRFSSPLRRRHDDPLFPQDYVPTDDERDVAVHRPGWTVGAAFGMVARASQIAGPGVDGLIRLDADKVWGHGVGVGGGLSLLPGGDSQVDAVDVSYTAGGRYRRHVGRRVALSLGAELGVLSHHRRPAAPDQLPAAFAMFFPFTVSIAWKRGPALDIQALTGLYFPRIREEAWDRGSLAFGLALGIRGLWLT